LSEQKRYITNIVIDPSGRYIVTDIKGHTHIFEIMPKDPDEFIQLIDKIAEMLQNATITLNTSTGQITIKINW